MNERITCDICGKPALPREWLLCTHCRRRFHFAPAAGGMAPRCGLIVPRADSDGCCGALYACSICAGEFAVAERKAG